MGYQIVKQGITDKQIRAESGEPVELEPGRYCIFSSVVDTITAFNLSHQDVIDFFVDMAVEGARRSVGRKLDQIDQGIPAYHQFTMTFEEVLKMTITHQSDDEDE